MAGGPLAAVVPCMICWVDHQRRAPATRVREGRESDDYECALGHAFGQDWRAGPATSPQWTDDADLDASG